MRASFLRSDLSHLAGVRSAQSVCRDHGARALRWTTSAPYVVSTRAATVHRPYQRQMRTFGHWVSPITARLHPGWLNCLVRDSGGRIPGSASTRVAISAALGAASAVATGALGEWVYAFSVGWDVAAVCFLGWTWLAIAGMDPASTEAHATQEDPTKRATQAIVLGASVVSLVVVGLLLVKARNTAGAGEVVLAALAVSSIALSWLVVHTLFTLRYALLYYDPDEGGSNGTVGGIDFGESAPPCYSDFAYLAFTVGMTYQVSDTQLGTRDLRRAVLRHSLVSYLFGALILAGTVNLLVSLASSGG